MSFDSINQQLSCCTDRKKGEKLPHPSWNGYNMDNNFFGAAMPPSGTCAHDKVRFFALSWYSKLKVPVAIILTWTFYVCLLLETWHLESNAGQPLYYIFISLERYYYSHSVNGYSYPFSPPPIKTYYTLLCYISLSLKPYFLVTTPPTHIQVFLISHQ